MAKIISGLSPEDAGFAYLKGQGQGLDLASEQRKERERAQERMQEHQEKIQKAMLEHHKEEAKSLALLNKQAQMGDAQALQQLSLRIQAGAHPEAKVLKDAMGTVSRIHDPDAFKVAMEALHAGVKEYQARAHRAAAEKAIKRAGENGLADPEALKQRLDSGEDPQTITHDLAKQEQENNLKTLATQKSAEALKHAQALIESAPGGRNKLAAQYALTAFQNSPSDQAKPGADAKFLEEIQKTLLGTRGDEAAAKKQREEHTKAVLARPMPGLGGMSGEDMRTELSKTPTLGFGGPDIPPLDKSVGTHATLRSTRNTNGKAQKPVGQMALDLLPDSEDELDLAKKLKAAGVKLTPEVMAEVKAALDKRRNEVNAAAGADR